MNEFEQYLASNYGLKPGDDVPDDIYDRASSEFVQSRSTVPNIAPDSSSFSLDRSIPNSAPAPSKAQPEPRQQNANALQGTPFDYSRAVPILEQFAADLIDKDNLSKGAKYGDKASIEADWMNAREQIYGPALQPLGISTAKAQIAAQNVANGKATNMLEALGIPEPKANVETVDLGLKDQEEVAKLQTIAKTARETALNEDLTSEEKLQAKRQAQWAEQRINALLGLQESKPYEQFQEIQSTKREIERATQLGGGIIKYQGVPYPFENVSELTGLLGQKEKDLLDDFTQNRALLPVSRQSTLVYTKDGKIDAAASQKKYADALKRASVGDVVEKEDGTVGIYGGPSEEKSGRSWVPKPLQPAMKGAEIVASDVAKVAIPIAQKGIDVSRKGIDAVTYVPRTVASYLPTTLLARKGLEYLSNVGRRAEEEEKKKRAGQ